MTISQAASVNLWREAILDRLAVLCMDAPQDEPPASILRRIIAAEVEIALDPSVSDAVPHRTLLQQALDALDAALSDDQPYIERSKAAITALRKALAEPGPEPAAWKHDCAALCTNDVELWIDACPHCGKPRTAPPTAPAPAAPVPDGLVPNAEEVICPNCAHQFRAIPENVQSLLLASGHEPPFTASPAALVAPLTEGRITAIANELAFGGGHCNVYELARAIEKAHGIGGGNG